jgi:hypothetical protein
VKLARHASLLGSQFEIDDTLGRSREAVTGTAPGSSRFKALGASLPKPVPCSSEGTQHADSTDKPPFVGTPARLCALRPALDDPCGAEHLARKAKGSFHGLRSFSFASGPAAMPGDNIGCTLTRIMLAKAA